MAAEQNVLLPSGDPLYQAMLARRSFRRYQDQPLPVETLDKVKAMLTSIKGLVETNRFTCVVKNTTGLNLAESLGAYGHIVNPPHFLVPYLQGTKFTLTDLGYRVEQINVHLIATGIGTCYLGAISRQDQVRRLFGLPADAVIGALLIFGVPGESLGGRTVNAFIHNIVGAENKLTIEKICFEDGFDQPVRPSEHLRFILEAARRAPSAVNAQPWRLLLNKGYLTMFVKREISRHGADSQGYHYHDAGICMAHISLALHTLGRQPEWELLDPADKVIPPHPELLEPLARIEI